MLFYKLSVCTGRFDALVKVFFFGFFLPNPARNNQKIDDYDDDCMQTRLRAHLR